MKLSRIDIYHYTLPLIRKISVAGTLLTQREGFLISLIDDQGNAGYGEVSPLPGLDVHSLESCKKELVQAKGMLDQQPLHIENICLTDPMLGLVTLKDQFNQHVMFGLENALMCLALKYNPGLFGSDFQKTAPYLHPVKVNGLYVPDSSKSIVQSQLDQLEQSGFSTIKVKVGRINISNEIKQIQTLWNSFDRDITLRLDANKSLSFETYQQYYKELQSIPVEYVEEPLQNSDFKAASRVPWPLALDESLNLFFNQKTLDFSGIPKGITTLIIKPSSLSGLSSFFAFMQKADAMNLNIVLSSAFNTSLGIIQIGSLAAFHPAARNTAHGLDTLKYLKDDVITDVPAIQNGCLKLTEKHYAGEFDLNTSCLHQVN